jgi:hypothetical protein
MSIEERRNTEQQQQHFIIQTGTGFNFMQGSRLTIGKKIKLQTLGQIKESGSDVGYYAVPSGMKNAQPGDKIWFVKSDDKQYASYVADIVFFAKQRTFTDTEMGWNGDGTECPFEIVYTNLVNVRNCQIQLIEDYKKAGQSTVRNYKSKKVTADLPTEYANIHRYRHARVEYEMK